MLESLLTLPLLQLAMPMLDPLIASLGEVKESEQKEQELVTAVRLRLCRRRCSPAQEGEMPRHRTAAALPPATLLILKVVVAVATILHPEKEERSQAACACSLRLLQTTITLWAILEVVAEVQCLLLPHLRCNRSQ